MDTFIKLRDIAVAGHMDLEPDGEPKQSPPISPSTHKVAACGTVIRHDPPAHSRPTPEKELGITQLVMPGGKTMPALKSMITTACERNCFYCPFRAGRSYRRQTVKPDEMAETFMKMVRARKVEGLFLSSGIIKGGVTTQDKLIDTAEILRHKYSFRGYIHLKVMPGLEKDQLRRAMELSSRLSVNLEAPNDHRLALLAPKKQFVEELIRPLQWIEEIRREEAPNRTWNGRWPSSVTQFVVGGAGESDLELLSTSERLLKQLKLQRVYYSSFKPIKDTPLENVSPSNPLREHRLYQSSFLFRDYGYDLEELPFDKKGNLPLNEDPKLAWARANLIERPLELNRASREELLRIPGIGPLGAEKILKARRQGKIRGVKDLKSIGVQTKRLASYVLFDGRRPQQQLRLFG